MDEGRSAIVNRLQQLEAALDHEKQQPIRIGILGVRGACKSSLLAALYMFGRDDARNNASDNGLLLPSWYRRNENRRFDLQPDEPSMTMLKGISNDIKKHGTATATPLAKAEIIRFTMYFGRNSVNIETLDFSGYFLAPMARGEELKGLAEEARDFLRRCSVVLCLVNWNDEALETSDAIDICFREVPSRPHFLLALTKFDERWDYPTTHNEEEDIIEQCHQLNPGLRGLRRRLSDVYSNDGQANRMKTMLLAPLGGDFGADQSRKKPLERHDLNPYNICGPFVMAYECREQKLAQLQNEVAVYEEKLAKVDGQIREALKSRIESIATTDPRAPGAGELDAELQDIKAKASEMEAVYAASLAARALADRASKRALAECQQLKNQLSEIIKEIHAGNPLQWPSQVETLTTMKNRAEKLGDTDIARQCATEIRRLGPKAHAIGCFMRCVNAATSKSFELLPTLLMTVFILVFCFSGIFVVVWLLTLFVRS